MRWSVLVLVFIVAALAVANSVMLHVQLKPAGEIDEMKNVPHEWRSSHAGVLIIYKTTPDDMQPVLRRVLERGAGAVQPNACPIGQCQDV